MTDGSNGYDAIAAQFLRARNPAIGSQIVGTWARTLPPGAAVLDLGCGNGIPITRTLVDAGLAVAALDASPRMVSAFRSNFPGVPVTCEPAEASAVLEGRFGGIVAWGLVFLLPAERQIALIHRAAAALEPGGSFLFTAPEPACRWEDVLTRRESVSLGAPAYRAHLAEAGLSLVGEHRDEGANHYFESRRSVHF
ncbi:MAG TPA: class I SAM-dependent methyltransferase [Gemmatimonadales bacterium]|nr:class I SAM-dependent methyltransferase [Gemmatimonadales bacterium]